MNRTDTRVRDAVADTVRRYMCGPFGGENEILAEPPQRFYVTGVLYPQQYLAPEHEAEESEEEAEPALALEDDALLDGDRTKHRVQAEKLAGVALPKEEVEYDRELNLSTDFKPASFGLSVFTGDASCRFRIRATYGLYQSVKSAFSVAEAPAGLQEPAAAGPSGGWKPATYKRTPVTHDFVLVAEDEQFSLLDDSGTAVADDGTCEGRSRAFALLDKLISLRITRRVSNVSGVYRSIFTISLINISPAAKTDPTTGKRDSEFFIFQPGLALEADEPLFSPGPEGAGEGEHLSPEDRVRNLLFRNYRNYGAGHGASADWDLRDVHATTMKINRVRAVVIPEYDVQPVDFNLKIQHRDDDIILSEAEEAILSMKRLAGLTGEKVGVLAKMLRAFTARYGEWIGQQQQKAKALASEHVEAADANLEKCRQLLARMSRGIDLLLAAGDNPVSNIVLRAFQDANRAMFMQRVMKKFADKRLKANVLPGEADEAPPGIQTAPESDGVWRPFQLAFLLSQIEGLISPESEDRETVDLIWFSTGGGKTEAYLGLTAFTIFFRRLKAGTYSGNPDDGAGISVLMRYTLRLLNIQQFNRAAVLICACELIRRQQPQGLYGQAEISTGIWVGRSLTPNNTGNPANAESAVGAIHQYQQFLDGKKGKPDLSPPLSHCPCCGTRIVPERRKDRIVGEWGYFQLQQMQYGRKYGPKGKAVAKTGSIVYLSCRNGECPFHVSPDHYTNQDEVERRKLPVYYVDDVVYDRRPSLLFATVDKFAQLTWNPRTGRLFNLGRNADGSVRRDFAGPDLIIQDELHLISSALGTMYGIYEFAVDQLCRWGGAWGAKIVGASATVRNAESQCRNLYGRRGFAQFPPQGIDTDDSFFSRLDTKSPGRRYLGVMPAGRTATINIIYLTGRAMQLIPALPFENEDLDWYYTMLVYFNSTKELGKFRTLLTDDISAHRYGMHNTFAPLGVSSLYVPFRIERTAELSSAMTADQIYKYLNQLENARLPAFDGKPDAEATSQRALLHKVGVRSACDLDGNRKWRRVFTPALLTSLHLTPIGADGEEAPDLFQKLRARLEILLGTPKEEPIHVAAATNMISVGVDIERLNLMQIAGQPKSTAEYIQASSRAGRNYPGLVVTSYNNAKSRDRSHYESFADYHQAFYKHVEANSVTPFSLPALEKALPSVLIALMRLLHFPMPAEAAPGAVRKDHNAYWPEDAAGEPTTRFYDNLVSLLKERVSDDLEGVATLRENIDRVAQDLKELWMKRSAASTPGPNLQFAENGHFYPSPDDARIDLDLFVTHDYPERKRARRPAVLTSLRNVEPSSPLIIQY